MACLNLDFAAWQSLVWSWVGEGVVAVQSVAVRLNRSRELQRYSLHETALAQKRWDLDHCSGLLRWGHAVNPACASVCTEICTNP
jgi:hypothetical protein